MGKKWHQFTVNMQWILYIQYRLAQRFKSRRWCDPRRWSFKTKIKSNIFKKPCRRLTCQCSSKNTTLHEASGNECHCAPPGVALPGELGPSRPRWLGPPSCRRTQAHIKEAPGPVQLCSGYYYHRPAVRSQSSGISVWLKAAALWLALYFIPRGSISAEAGTNAI